MHLGYARSNWFTTSPGAVTPSLRTLGLVTLAFCGLLLQTAARAETQTPHHPAAITFGISYHNDVSPAAIRDLAAHHSMQPNVTDRAPIAISNAASDADADTAADTAVDTLANPTSRNANSFSDPNTRYFPSAGPQYFNSATGGNRRWRNDRWIHPNGVGP